MKYTHSQIGRRGIGVRGREVECLKKALLMARCIRKGMKKVKLQILRIPNDHRAEQVQRLGG